MTEGSVEGVCVLVHSTLYVLDHPRFESIEFVYKLSFEAVVDSSCDRLQCFLEVDHAVVIT